MRWVEVCLGPGLLLWEIIEKNKKVTFLRSFPQLSAPVAWLAMHWRAVLTCFYFVEILTLNSSISSLSSLGSHW